MAHPAATAYGKAPVVVNDGESEEEGSPRVADAIVSKCRDRQMLEKYAIVRKAQGRVG